MYVVEAILFLLGTAQLEFAQGFRIGRIHTTIRLLIKKFDNYAYHILDLSYRWKIQ